MRAWQGWMELGGKPRGECIALHPRCCGLRRGASLLRIGVRGRLVESSNHCLGHGLETRQREGLGLAQVARRELALLFAVGFPVPAPALVTCLLTACGEAASLADEGERGGRLQPGKPGRGSHGQDLLLTVLPIDQGLALDGGSHG
ncbi:MAG TPA: hypothetical protein VEL31_05655 [Ktedonobacteraceae bacterium]|nr:hypothetical protein [Ktedonobacteraceae bacterium]